MSCTSRLLLHSSFIAKTKLSSLRICRSSCAATALTMDSELSFKFRNQSVPVSFLPSVSREVAQLALSSEVFKTWSRRCEAEKDGRRIDVHSVEIQHVDMFGSRVGFVKIKAESTLVDRDTKNHHRLPGICFLRGGAVAILIVLICEENDGEMYSLLVDQPR